MTMDAAAVTILLQLLDRATAWGSVIAQARAEGRPVSPAEIDGFFAADDAADKRLAEAIAKARAEGR
jgi:hypothetical protein